MLKPLIRTSLISIIVTTAFGQPAAEADLKARATELRKQQWLTREGEYTIELGDQGAANPQLSTKLGLASHLTLNAP